MGAATAAPPGKSKVSPRRESGTVWHSHAVGTAHRHDGLSLQQDAVQETCKCAIACCTRIPIWRYRSSSRIIIDELSQAVI